MEEEFAGRKGLRPLPDIGLVAPLHHCPDALIRHLEGDYIRVGRLLDGRHPGLKSPEDGAQLPCSGVGHDGSVSLMQFTESNIHAGLVKKCDGIVEDLRKAWAGESDSTAIVWPGEDVLDDKGNPIADTVLLELPDDRKTWRNLLDQLVTRTSAFGLLVVDRRDDMLKVIFESPKGSRSWTLKKERHGDVSVLNSPTVLDDVESAGLLWKPRATA
jgi:hypothetical protein